MSDQPSVIKPSLTAGLIFGFISGLPFISYLNCICCSLILGAGILSSYLLVKASAVGVTYSRAALGGFLTGLFAAPIWFLTNVAIMIIVGYDLSSRMQDLFDQVGASTPETQQVIQLLSGAGIYLVLAIAFAFSPRCTAFSARSAACSAVPSSRNAPCRPPSPAGVVAPPSTAARPRRPPAKRLDF
ncbi:MAG: hypothetical protein ACE5HU_05560 [Acidobacteriota bacterium]